MSNLLFFFSTFNLHCTAEGGEVEPEKLAVLSNFDRRDLFAHI